MKTIRVLLTVLLLVGTLGLSLISVSRADVHSESMRVTENLRGGVVLLPPSAPETDRLTLVSFITIVPDAEVLGAIAVYDNPQTTRPVDYIELYDGSGIFCKPAGSINMVFGGLQWTARFFRKRPRGSKECSPLY